MGATMGGVTLGTLPANGNLQAVWLGLTAPKGHGPDCNGDLTIVGEFIYQGLLIVNGKESTDLDPYPDTGAVLASRCRKSVFPAEGTTSPLILPSSEGSSTVFHMRGSYLKT
jgi:hypothetical protein